MSKIDHKMLVAHRIAGRTRRPGGRAVALLVSLAAVTILHGCITATAIAVVRIYRRRTSQGYILRAQVPRTPDQVYAAMVEIIRRRPDLSVHSMDATKHMAEVSNKADERVSVQAKAAGDGSSELIVTVAKAGGGRAKEQLALDVITMICDELGVRYKLSEVKDEP